MKNKILISLLLLMLFFQGKAQYKNDLEIEQILKSDTTSIGQKIRYPNFQNEEVTMLKITIPSGKTTGWHEHNIPVFAYVLKGTLTVEFEGNRVVQFKENSSFAEVIHTQHRGINNEKEDLVLLAFYLGEKGKPLSIMKEKP
ncbi:MAG: cupin domain-containing protein [Prolixibacteraceae bacterium]